MIRQNKVTGWAWFSEIGKEFGIVTYMNIANEKKAYIGNVKGNDNVFEDLKHIVDTGAKFYFEAAELAIKQMGTVKDIDYKDLMP